MTSSANNYESKHSREVDEMTNNAFSQMEEHIASCKGSKSNLLEQTFKDSKDVLKGKRMEAFKKNHLFVFVSLSMPSESLLSLAKEAKKTKGILVLRGLHKSSFKETIKALQAVISASKQGFLIDPELYQKYEIKEVPAIVVKEGDLFDKISGNISIKYALEKFSLEGDTSKTSSSYLHNLKGEKHD